MSPTVVSAIYGGYDTLKAAPGPGCVLFTDRPLEDPMGWEVVVLDFPVVNPRLKSKIPKFAAHLLCSRVTSDWIWADGSFALEPGIFDAVGLVPPGGIGSFRHRVRVDVAREAEFSMLTKRHRGTPVYPLICDMQKQGYDPEKMPLPETGIIVWRNASVGPECAWEMVRRALWHDQLVFPWVMQRQGVRLTFLPGDLVNPPVGWGKWLGHA